MRTGLVTLMLYAVVGLAADRPGNLASTAMASAPASNGGDVVIFSGTKYFLRTAKDGQYVFTPGGQEDLQRWTDMITLSYYPEITEGKSLAAKAIAWWEHCRWTRTRIWRINFVPRLDQMHAGDADLYTAVTVHEKPYNDYDDISYTALRIIEGTGTALVYSHREYRKGLVSLQRNDEWVRKNVPLEEAWFVWDGMPEYRMLVARHPAVEEKAVTRDDATTEAAPWTHPRT